MWVKYSCQAEPRATEAESQGGCCYLSQAAWLVALGSFQAGTCCEASTQQSAGPGLTIPSEYRCMLWAMQARCSHANIFASVIRSLGPTVDKDI